MVAFATRTKYPADIRLRYNTLIKNPEFRDKVSASTTDEYQKLGAKSFHISSGEVELNETQFELGEAELNLVSHQRIER